MVEVTSSYFSIKLFISNIFAEGTNSLSAWIKIFWKSRNWDESWTHHQNHVFNGFFITSSLFQTSLPKTPSLYHHWEGWPPTFIHIKSVIRAIIYINNYKSRLKISRVFTTVFIILLSFGKWHFNIILEFFLKRATLFICKV